MFKSLIREPSVSEEINLVIRFTHRDLISNREDILFLGPYLKI